MTAAEPPPSTAEAEARSGSRRARRARRRRHPALEWGLVLGLALVVALIIRAFVFQTYWIPSESMLPTLQVDDRVLVNKLSYRLHDPNRSDLVVFKAPPETETADIKDLIKRVVGLPGETIEGRNGQISINGRVLEESYLPEGVRSRTFGPVKVPPDSYYLLGDNRQASQDSTVFGPIRRNQLIGRAFFRLWPLSRFGFL